MKSCFKQKQSSNDGFPTTQGEAENVVTEFILLAHHGGPLGGEEQGRPFRMTGSMKRP